jgi:hypothetical protein
MEVRCKDCDLQIDYSLDRFLDNGTEPIPCPKCNCRLRNVKMTFSDSNVEIHDDSSIKGKIKGRKKPIFEGKYGTELYHDSNTLQQRERTFNKPKDLYYELILNPILGYFRETEEKRSEHFNHGTAKKKGKDK